MYATRNDLIRIVKDKFGSAPNRGVFDLQIIGVRASLSRSDNFDDFLYVLYKTDQDTWQFKRYDINTCPGKWNRFDRNIGLIPGRYKESLAYGFSKGTFRPFPCLKQIVSMSFVDDMTKDIIYTSVYDKSYEQNEGIRFTRKGSVRAGDQVFKKKKDLQEFMELCEQHAKRWGNRFTYTLLEESDL